MAYFELIIVLIILPFAIAGISFAPWVPTRSKDIKRGLDLAKMKPNEIFFELGCGDGRVVFFANKNYKVNATGIELCFPLFLICKIKQLFYGNKKINFKNKNLYKLDLKEADIIYMYGMPDKLKKLKDKFQKELKPGARIVSYIFPIEGIKPNIISKPKEKELPIYLYKF